jgi:hypothetical protein
MTTDDGEAPDDLTPRERARLRSRDRKRTTQMVVDNAGIKRMALALAQRRAPKAVPPATEERQA